ncbi:FAD-dependent oxidoreductase [Polynucleobacter paludilacus]|uniref:FAD-dependent oxidoreductase n=1 Tax=Polynucleobacter paludilacus TaxID=1855895 RepID=UPI001BFD0184|nr:FAD-dependent oxidoreductase [Polynucleobacter paludilacus]QWD86477.1 FAD-dependent oxidoreductase [Polynucleobacter paludilacus]
MNILIIGAGFSGAVIARELADQGHKITVIEKRNHIGGNAYDFLNEHGIRQHLYGPHLFHTSNQEVVDWLSRFTEWTPYFHKVKAMLSSGQLVTLPVNQETIEIVGEKNILDIFFRPYSKKMWGLNLEEIDAEILNRVPIRNDQNELYFPDDKFQGLPSKGYTNLFVNIFDHPQIKVLLNKPYSNGIEAAFDFIFNSMPIDEFFDYSCGVLPYRSIKFHNFTLPIPRLFPVSVVNFTHSEPYTRVTEWKNLPNHGDSQSHTSLTIEEPCDFTENNYERYYPVKDVLGANRKIYKLYEGLVPHNMEFIGRCGLYAYMDMHQAINSALKTVKRFSERN